MEASAPIDKPWVGRGLGHPLWLGLSSTPGMGAYLWARLARLPLGHASRDARKRQLGPSRYHGSQGINRLQVLPRTNPGIPPAAFWQAVVILG